MRNKLHSNRGARMIRSCCHLGWPIAVIVCVSVSVAGVLVLYLVARIRSSSRQRSQLTATGDDLHSQMEWEDDIGLNIIVNPLDETKVRRFRGVFDSNVLPFLEIRPISQSSSSERRYGGIRWYKFRV